MNALPAPTVSLSTLFRTLLLSLAIAGFPLSPHAANGLSVFINEFHYDNSGSDSNEGVEIAGPGGTVLDGWQLLFYNGNGGDLYKSLMLNGTLPDLGTGFGLLAFTTPGLQNGPDGIALADPLDQVVQFLSYEGIVTATEGPASGLSSESLPVAESSSGSALESLQLAGSGRYYTDFSWNGPQLASFGALNPGQSFDAPLTPSPVPLPATLPLLLSGLAGLGLVSRRRRVPSAIHIPA
ncbi:MAG: VPLPA-CTERM sorting domain-containing protein [Gammaproteobacteria bacterium]|nr:VPLPA-CTERM sorting domain-containing protein [Gammaproteobacteria bacterium]